jgi:N-acetylglutamate synthase-like GNAT family acetyltransferase
LLVKVVMLLVWLIFFTPFLLHLVSALRSSKIWSFRSGGVGSQLLEQAIHFARANGCKRITLLTDRTNEPAQRFYQKHGFAFSAMVPLRLSLSELCPTDHSSVMPNGALE